jgi:hypothetical protein
MKNDHSLMSLMKNIQQEIEEDTSRWKDLRCSQISRINNVKAICRFNTIPTKIPEIDKITEIEKSPKIKS